MKLIHCFILAFLLPFTSCKGQENNSSESTINSSDLKIDINKDSLEILEFYSLYHGNDLPSVSKGTVSNGELINGKLFPYYGSNFTYFDLDSYFGFRAFTNNITHKIILDSYDFLKQEYPDRKFVLMELSNLKGGKIQPHRTHQNGLSADFMMPKLKNGEAFYGLDSLGKDHYLLDFNADGVLKKDSSIMVDFDLIARHILILNDNANKLGYKISKVIIKIEYKTNLFRSLYGKELKESGIYIVRNLSPLINAIHDDHFHIDFEKK